MAQLPTDRSPSDAADDATAHAADHSELATQHNAFDTATPYARANHTGTQSADTLTDGTTNKAFLATERTKLTGVATAATANSSDATLLARGNHTGTQLAATISDFSEAVDDRVATLLVAGTNITLTYNDAAGTLTIDAATGGGGGLTQEQAEDIVAAMIADNSDLDWTYTDNGTSAGSLVAVIKAGSVTNAMLAGSIALSKLATDPLARANHTGTQTASTVSDFSEAVDDRVDALLVAGAGITKTYNDASGSLTLANAGPTTVTVTASTGSTALDFGGLRDVIFDVTLNASTTFSFSNVPSGAARANVYLRQGTGGSRVPTFPASVQWASHVTPTDWSTAVGTYDVVGLETLNGGTDWAAFDGSPPAGVSSTQMCQVKLSAHYPLPTSTVTMIPWDAEDTDPGNWHSTTVNNSRIVPNNGAGIYVVSACLGPQSTLADQKRFYLDVFLNGVRTGFRSEVGGRGLGTFPSPALSCPVSITNPGTDYIEIAGWQDQGTDLTIHLGVCRMSVHGPV